MIWLKAWHVIFMVTWFAGLFYLPRLFVYHATATDAASVDRFGVMERRLFILMTLGGTFTVVFGLAMIALRPGYFLELRWLQLKLALVVLLLAYHGYCYRLLRDFALGRNQHSARWYRIFNELPSLLLVAIVLLAILKP